MNFYVYKITTYQPFNPASPFSLQMIFEVDPLQQSSSNTRQNTSLNEVEKKTTTNNIGHKNRCPPQPSTDQCQCPLPLKVNDQPQKVYMLETIGYRITADDLNSKPIKFNDDQDNSLTYAHVLPRHSVSFAHSDLDNRRPSSKVQRKNRVDKVHVDFHGKCKRSHETHSQSGMCFWSDLDDTVSILGRAWSGYAYVSSHLTSCDRQLPMVESTNGGWFLTKIFWHFIYGRFDWKIILEIIISHKNTKSIYIYIYIDKLYVTRRGKWSIKKRDSHYLPWNILN